MKAILLGRKAQGIGKRGVQLSASDSKEGDVVGERTLVRWGEEKNLDADSRFEKK